MNLKKAFFFQLFISLIILTGNCTTTAQKETAPAASVKEVSAESEDFWKKQRDKALGKRTSPVGKTVPGLTVPKELMGDGVIKQKAKLKEMMDKGYEQPLDFDDLAGKFVKGELSALPIASDSFVIEVGGVATDEQFSSFTFENGVVPLAPESPGFSVLKKLSENFDGAKYDLNNPQDRKKFRFHLLRMLNPAGKNVLEEIAKAYQKKFERPMLINSMTRSMDYQIELNKVDANSFLVRGKGALPPHISGMAFDIVRSHMTAEEQNFLMNKLAEMERAGLVDALIEYGDNAVFHVFVYPDGIPPKLEN